MFRALVWKEWRQLALVRWGGIFLGALLPIVLTLAAELARRGGRLDVNAKPFLMRDVMFELVPAAMALGIWPLIGLMSAAQAVAGDRAAGTEAFLIERPVPAGRVWRARILAAFVNVAVVVAVTGGIAATVAALSGAPTGPGWSRFTMLGVLGAALAALALLGGLIASSLISSPMGAVLLGAVLGALPVALAAQLALFEYARMGRVPLGAVLSILVLPAYVAGSWLALCRGEPAGRGRLRRAVTVVATTIAGVVVLFVSLAPILVRANAMSGMHTVFASRSGGSVFATSRNDGGWIVDVASAKRLAFVPPPVGGAVWAPDGSEVAFLTESGPLGSIRSGQRLEIRSTADGRVLRSIPVDENKFVYRLCWADAGIVAVVSPLSSQGSGAAEVEIIDPVTGKWRPTGFRWQGWSMDLVGPRQDGRVFVQAMVEEKLDDGRLVARGHRLHPVDVAAAEVGPALRGAEGQERLFAGWRTGVSPSGRLARIIPSEGASRSPRIVELESGADQPSAAIPSWAVWTEGDRLVWHEDLDHDTRLFVETPGEPPRVLRAWRDSQVGVEPSPDGRAVFVSVIPSGEAPTTDSKWRPDRTLFEGPAPVGAGPEEWVYLPSEDRLVSMGQAFSGRPHDHLYTQWAGPRTLARFAPGVLYFEDLDAPGKRRFVIGGVHDLE